MFCLVSKQRIRLWWAYALLLSLFCGRAWAEGPQGDALALSHADALARLSAAVERIALEYTGLMLALAALLILVFVLVRRRNHLLARMAEAARSAQASGRRRSVAQAVTEPPATESPVAEATPVEPTALPPRPADDSRLPDAPPWVGRQAPLALLEASLADPQVAVVGLVGEDGVGKTRLMRHWADQCGGEGQLKSFFWSFAAESASEVEVDRFFSQALSFFAPPGETPALLPAERGAQLVRWLTGQPALLLLDGVERLQPVETGGAHAACWDRGLGDFFRLLASGVGAWPNGLVVLTARQHVAELAAVQGGVYRHCLLEPFKEKEATQLLHGWGVRGKFADFRPVVKGLQGNPLLLTLFGRLISRYYQGSVANQAGLAALLEPGGTGEVLERLLAHYESFIWSGDPAYGQMLRLLALSHASVDEALLQRVCQEGGLHPLNSRDAEWWHAMRVGLQRAGWLESGCEGESGVQPCWLLHPSIRACYVRQWDGEERLRYQQAIGRCVMDK